MTSQRLLTPLLGLSLILSAGLTTQAQDAKVKDPESKHGLALKARKATEEEFGKDTRRYGVEVYLDQNNGNGLYISEIGSIASVPAKLFKPGDGKGKEPLWRHGLKLTARPAGEKEWDRGRKFGLEAYLDETDGNLVFINEGGDVDVIAGSLANDQAIKGKPKNPTWKHSWDVKVRKAGEKDFKEAKKIGVEVFRDENNGNLIYISDTGSFASVAGKLVDKDDSGKDPVWQHGLELQVRKAGEREFTKDTKKYGLEVFLDGNNGSLMYVTEAGNIAVVPGKWARPTEAGKSRPPELKHAMDLQVRKAGDKDFTPDSKKFGVEAYADENNGNLIYISETGDITIVPSKTE